MKKLFLLFLLLPVTSQTTEKKAELIVTKDQGVNGLGDLVISFSQGNKSVRHWPKSNEYLGVAISLHGGPCPLWPISGNVQGSYLALEKLYNAQQKSAAEKLSKNA